MPLAEDAQDIFSGTTDDLTLMSNADIAYPKLAVDYVLSFNLIALGFVAFCIKASKSLDIICRPWAPAPSYYFAPDGSLKYNRFEKRLSSWVCTLDEAVFETREDGHYVRKRGDSFVGVPGRPIYQASKGFPVINFEDLDHTQRPNSSNKSQHPPATFYANEPSIAESSEVSADEGAIKKLNLAASLERDRVIETMIKALLEEKGNQHESEYRRMARKSAKHSKEFQTITSRLEQAHVGNAVVKAAENERQQQKVAISAHLEMARFPIDTRPFSKPRRLEVKGITIGTIQSLGERAMEGTIPSGWLSMANWPQRRSPIPEALYRTLIADRNADGGNPPSWYKRALEHSLANSGMSDVRLQRMINQSRSTVTGELLRRVQSVIWNRRFIITDQGAFGLVPAKALVGDVVMILYGASVPIVLRKLVSSYCVVGECYIHGSMDGLKSGFRAGVSTVMSGDSSRISSRSYEPQIVTIR